MNKNNFKKLFFLYFPDLLAVLILLISGIVYTHGLENFLDISDIDESTYLHWGVSFPTGFPIPEWSPPYVLWYFFLSLFQPDTISLYYLNYTLMTILPPLFMYIFLRINNVHMVISFLFSILFLLNFSNFPTLPKVGHFALIFILSGMIVSNLFSDKKSKLFAFTLTVLLASYIRPEFILSFLLLAILLSILHVREFFRERTLRTFMPLTIIAALSLVLFLALGSPAGSGDRSFVAFGQHYSINWVKWHDDPRSPHANFKIILKEDFENASSVFEAFINNPQAILKHAAQNFKNLWVQLKPMFLKFYPSNPRRLILVALILVLIISIIPFSRNRMKTKESSILKQIRDNFRHYRFFIQMVLISLAPLILSIIFIFPRRHYLLLPVLLILLLLIIIFFRNAFPSQTSKRYLSLIFICIISLILVRPLKSLFSGQNQDNLLTINYLRSLEINDGVNLLEAKGFYSIYENENYTRVPEYQKEKLFNDYLKDHSINLIILSERLTSDTRFSTDPEWLYFVKNPEQFEFIQIDIPNVAENKILIRKDTWDKRKQF